MNRIVYILITLITFTLISSIQLNAHSPSGIKIDFSIDTKILHIEVIHPTNNTEKHYIERIEVYLDERNIIFQNFSKQKDNKKQEANYLVFEAEEGSIIKIKATCNIQGSKTEKFTIKKEERSE